MLLIWIRPQIKEVSSFFWAAGILVWGGLRSGGADLGWYMQWAFLESAQSLWCILRSSYLHYYARYEKKWQNLVPVRTRHRAWNRCDLYRASVSERDHFASSVLCVAILFLGRCSEWDVDYNTAIFDLPPRDLVPWFGGKAIYQSVWSWGRSHMRHQFWKSQQGCVGHLLFLSAPMT